MPGFARRRVRVSVGPMPTEGKGRLGDGFSPIERALIAVTPFLALLTCLYQLEKDARARVAEANERADVLRTEIEHQKQELAVLQAKLAARGTSQNESSAGTGSREPIRVRDPFDNVSGAEPLPTIAVQRWRLDELWLTVTVTGNGNASPMAMVKDPRLRLWPVRVGEYVGNQGCKVIAIDGDRVQASCPNGRQSIMGDESKDEPRPMIDVPDEYKGPPPRYDLRDQPGRAR